MAENETQFSNLKKLIELAGEGSISALLSSVKTASDEVKKLRDGLRDKSKAILEEKEAKLQAAQEEPAEIKEEPKKESEVPKTEETAVEEATKEPVKEEPKKEEPKNEEPRKEEKVQPVIKEQKPKKEYSTDFIVKKASEIKEEQKAKARKEYVPTEDRRQKPNFENRRPQNNAPRQIYTAPSFTEPTANAGRDRNFGTNKKKGGEKNYEEKKTISKRALIKSQISVEDFDEDKTGYRKMRPAKKQKAAEQKEQIKIEKAVITTETVPLKVLSEKLGIAAVEITKKLFKEGIMKTINDSIDYDTAAYIAADLGIELELKLEKTAEDKLTEVIDDTQDDANSVRRPPVVTVMGHVDHGKTSLLDRIRKTNVTGGEAGGITQHIGAYMVSVGGKKITFLDTPGHAAFTAMRARGAQATDIAVLVIAADDGIMPQTIEAINHAKAADVPIIVAVNKIDKPEANIERIKTQLADNDLLIEEWGGDILLCPLSAKTGEGIDNLLESINLIAEVKDLKANPDRKAKGVVVEAKLDQSRGPVATVLIKTGTLKVGDSIVVGTVTGKVRAMIDDTGRKITSAGPSVPVSVMGFDNVPQAGDTLYAVEQEKLSRLVAEERKNKEKEERAKNAGKVTLDDVFNKIAEGKVKGLNIIVKADVQGSVEAVKDSLLKLSNEEVKVNVIHAAAGAINESDIMLADSSNAIIIGFNVRPDSNAKVIAERSGVDIKLYRVIYEAIEDVERALKGMLAPKYKETYMGKAEVRETFKITGVGMVAGCYVTEGKIVRNGKLRIYRNDVMITEGNVLQLKRFKDDVKEVAQGFECGISIEKFNDIKNDDFIECYLIEEVKD